MTRARLHRVYLRMWWNVCICRNHKDFQHLPVPWDHITRLNPWGWQEFCQAYNRRLPGYAIVGRQAKDMCALSVEKSNI